MHKESTEKAIHFYGVKSFRSFTKQRVQFFPEILKFMRFDDKPNQIRRGPNIDKFAPIREVFEKFPHCAKANTWMIFL